MGVGFLLSCNGTTHLSVYYTHVKVIFFFSFSFLCSHAHRFTLLVFSSCMHAMPCHITRSLKESNFVVVVFHLLSFHFLFFFLSLVLFFYLFYS